MASILVAAGLAAKPGYQAVKHWRCTKLAEESSQLLERHELDQAFSRARAAHQLLPEEPAALRAVARVLTARGDWGNAYAFWAEVVKRAATPADRREYVEASLQTGAVPVAVEQLGILLEKEPESAENRLLEAKVKLAQRDMASAVQAARKANELDPKNESAALLLSQLLLQTPETKDEGLQRLHRLSEGPTATGLLALSGLTTLPELSNDELLQLARALREHPLAEEGHRLRALELELRGTPEKRSEILDKAQAQYAEAAPDSFRAFTAWLISQKEPARTLQMLPVDRAMTRKDLFLVRLDAMAALGQWREILTALTQDRVPLETPLVNLYQSRCWSELGNKGQADIALREAQSAAAGDLNLLLYIAGYAEKIGARERAADAYRTLTPNPKVARIAYEALLRLHSPTDTLGLRNLLVEMAKRWPNDTALRNDLAYLNTLLNIDVEKNRETARQLVESAPESLPHRTVLALAELREGNPAAALKVYEGLQIDWRNAAPGAVVVYASALRQAGRVEEAKELVSALTASALRPEEQTLLAAVQQP